MRVEKAHFNPPRVVFCGKYDMPFRGGNRGADALCPVEQAFTSTRTAFV
jgi:hypothetical protein